MGPPSHSLAEASKFCRETSPWPGGRYRGARREVRPARSCSDASGMVESADSASGALGTVLVAVPGIRTLGAYNGAGSPRAQPAVLPVQGAAPTSCLTRSWLAPLRKHAPSSPLAR